MCEIGYKKDNLDSLEEDGVEQKDIILLKQARDRLYENGGDLLAGLMGIMEGVLRNAGISSRLADQFHSVTEEIIDWLDEQFDKEIH